MGDELSATPTPTKADALAAIEKAWETVNALCSGKMRWEMRVPAEPDRDPDLVIGNALALARSYIEAAFVFAKHPYTCGSCSWEGETRDAYFDHVVAERHDHWERVTSMVGKRDQAIPA